MSENVGLTGKSYDSSSSDTKKVIQITKVSELYKETKVNSIKNVIDNNFYFEDFTVKLKKVEVLKDNAIKTF